MKMKTLPLYMAVLFIVTSPGIPLISQEGEQVGTISDINPASREIIVQSPQAAERIRMGARLCVNIDGKTAVMTVFYPMQTIAKCRLQQSDSGYLGRITRGKPVYAYMSTSEIDEMRSFESFLGIGGSNTIDQAIARLGKPSEHKTNSGMAFWRVSSETILSISYNKNTKRVENIFLHKKAGTKNFIASRRITDKKTSLLGATKAIITKNLGAPASINTSGALQYTGRVKGKNFQASFYFDNGGTCSQIYVQYYD